MGQEFVEIQLVSWVLVRKQEQGFGATQRHMQYNLQKSVPEAILVTMGGVAAFTRMWMVA